MAWAIFTRGRRKRASPASSSRSRCSCPPPASCLPKRRRKLGFGTNTRQQVVNRMASFPVWTPGPCQLKLMVKTTRDGDYPRARQRGGHASPHLDVKEKPPGTPERRPGVLAVSGGERGLGEPEVTLALGTLGCHFTLLFLLSDHDNKGDRNLRGTRQVRIASWNVQWCRGLDGVVDPARIAAELRRIADPDIACLQEIASGFDRPAGEPRRRPARGTRPRAAGNTRRRSAGASTLPPRRRTRKRFGNMILSRLPLGRVRRHSLPWPAAPAEPSMPRIAIEAIVEAPFGPLRVAVHAPRVLPRGASRGASRPPARSFASSGSPSASARTRKGPSPQPSPASTIVCGDFNLPPDDPLHRADSRHRLHRCMGGAAPRRAAPAHVQAARARRRRVALLLRLRLRDARPRASPALDLASTRTTAPRITNHLYLSSA